MVVRQEPHQLGDRSLRDVTVVTGHYLTDNVAESEQGPCLVAPGETIADRIDLAPGKIRCGLRGSVHGACHDREGSDGPCHLLADVEDGLRGSLDHSSSANWLDRTSLSTGTASSLCVSTRWMV